MINQETINIVPIKHPQEIEVWYVMPAIRKAVAAALVKLGNTQKEVATLLNITPAAVSQYLKKKRAKDIVLPDDVKDFVDIAAGKIHDKKSAFRQVQVISRYVKESKAICRIHEGIEGNIDGCDVCYV
jgi:predicted transcriptional regulator